MPWFEGVRSRVSRRRSGTGVAPKEAMNEPLDRSALSLEKVVELARSIGTGMLVSHSPEGLRSRPMSVAEITDQGEIWFLTSMSSPKVAELTKDPHTLVVLRSEEHTSELQSPCNLVCRLLLEKK